MQRIVLLLCLCLFVWVNPASAGPNTCTFLAAGAMCDDDDPRDYLLHWSWDCPDESCYDYVTFDIEYKCCAGGSWQTLEKNWDPEFPYSATYIWTPSPTVCLTPGYMFRLTMKVGDPCDPCVGVDPDDCQRVLDCTVCPPK